MDDFQALVLLNMIPGLGSISIKRLLDVFGSARNIFKESPERLAGVNGISSKIANKIKKTPSNINLNKELQLAKQNNIEIITILDKRYPKNLKEIYDPPCVLYVKGNFLPSDKNSIGIVGSRRASFYGLSSAWRLSVDLSNLGFTINSGLARGIDTQAHKAAISTKGRTIAVLGSGLLNIYPPENKELSDYISENGALISEFSLMTPPLARNFPRRNRIISGLSLGVIVVEAARNSGALITADLALQQGREVFAVPGTMDASTSFGTNRLIQEGAKLLICMQDVIDEIGNKIEFSSRHKIHQEKETPVLTDTKTNRVFSFLSEEPKHIDEIINATKLEVPCLSGILVELQIKQLIKELPGKHYKRMYHG